MASDDGYRALDGHESALPPQTRPSGGLNSKGGGDCIIGRQPGNKSSDDERERESKAAVLFHLPGKSSVERFRSVKGDGEVDDDVGS